MNGLGSPAPFASNVDANYMFYSSEDWYEEMFPSHPRTLEEIDPLEFTFVETSPHDVIKLDQELKKISEEEKTNVLSELLNDARFEPLLDEIAGRVKAIAKKEYQLADLPKGFLAKEYQILLLDKMSSFPRQTEKLSHHNFEKKIACPLRKEIQSKGFKKEVKEHLDADFLESEELFNQLLSQIEQDLKVELPANQRVVAAKYKKIRSILERLPHLQGRYNAVLNKSYLNKFRKNPTKWLGTSTEALVLKHLGYDLTQYNDRQALRNEIERLVDEKLASSKLDQSPASLVAEIKEKTKLARYNLSDVPEVHIKYIAEVIKAVFAYRKKFTAAASKENLQIFNGSMNLIAELGKVLKEEKIENLKSQEVINFLQENKWFFLDLFHKNNLEEASEIIKQKAEYCFNDPRTTSVRSEIFSNIEATSSEIEWLTSYHSHVTVPFIQGFEDENAVFHSGICRAMVTKFQLSILGNPLIKDEDLNLGSLQPSHRFMHSAYAMNYRLAYDNSVPQKLLSNYVEERGEYEEKRSFIKNHILTLDGVISAGLASHSTGHAIGVQIDRAHHIFRFFDPNLGIVRFNFENKSTEEAVEEFAKIFQHYLFAFYPDHTKVCPNFLK